jgi:hypothetical protein
VREITVPSQFLAVFLGYSTVTENMKYFSVLDYLVALEILFIGRRNTRQPIK